MTTHTIAEAIRRFEAILRRKPAAGLADDAPAAACWKRGARFQVGHPNGAQIATDLPAELGGSGDQVSPGWLFRAGLASCAGTSILMAAAAEGLELIALEVAATSRSDARGLLGMLGDDGAPVDCGPGDLTLQVRIAARGVDAARLHAVVHAGLRRSPVPHVVAHATDLDLRIEVR